MMRELQLDSYDPNKGAVNDTSIVLRLGGRAERVLLAGDMQFARAEVVGLESEMAALLDVVNDNGPYDLIKTSHHTSDNGLDDAVLAGWSETRHLVHCGGLKHGDHHPDPDVLRMLKKHGAELELARTDRNGEITWTASDGFSVTSGRLNDFREN